MSSSSRHGSKYGGHNSDRDRDRDRRHSSHSRRDNRGRSTSPGPSRHREDPKPRDAKELPEAFGGSQAIRDRDEDLNILQRMKSSYSGAPLSEITDVANNVNKQVKVWTRNFKEVRGICTGFLTAFDKHWNLIMYDTSEVFLRSRKCKTPFLRDVAPDEDIPEMKPRVPKAKKTAEERAAAEALAAAEKAKAEAKPGKKKRRRRKPGPITEKRHLDKFFIRGDNIVMVAIVDPENPKKPADTENAGDENSE